MHLNQIQTLAVKLGPTCLFQLTQQKLILQKTLVWVLPLWQLLVVLSSTTSLLQMAMLLFTMKVTPWTPVWATAMTWASTITMLIFFALMLGQEQGLLMLTHAL